MKEMVIAGYDCVVPDRIISVEQKGYTYKSECEYITEFKIKTAENEEHACYIAVQVCYTDDNCRLKYIPQYGCYLSGEYSETGELEMSFNGNEVVNPFEYLYYDKENYNEEMDEFVNDLKEIAIAEAELKANLDAEDDIDEDEEEDIEEYE